MAAIYGGSKGRHAEYLIWKDRHCGERGSRPVLCEYEKSSDSFILHCGYEYQIECSRCDSAEKLIRWLVHLEKKGWWSLDMQHDLILRFSKRFDFCRFGL